MSTIVKAEHLEQPIMEAYKRELLKQLEEYILDIARPVIKEKAIIAMNELEIRIRAAGDNQFDQFIIQLTAQFKD